MAAVSATEFAREFGRYKEEAQREPIAITTQGRVSGYFVSPHECAELQRLRTPEQRAYPLSELPRGLVDAIVASKTGPMHDDSILLLDDRQHPDATLRHSRRATAGTGPVAMVRIRTGRDSAGVRGSASEFSMASCSSRERFPTTIALSPPTRRQDR